MKALQREWYQKLKDTGFQDIEVYSGGEQNRYRTNSGWIEKMGAERFLIKRDYYILAGHFLHDHDFKSEGEKEIWSLHSDGKTIRSIAKALEMRSCQVFLVIKRLRKKMMT